MRALGASRTSVVPGGALAGGWTRNALWKTARAVPSLDLRFADNKTLGDAVGGGSLVTFTRASTATFTGSDGLIKTAATNEARFDHNPTTGESLGLLVEEARTNLLAYSEQFDDATWTKNNCSITANTTIAPSNTLTGDTLTRSGTAASRVNSTGIAGSGVFTSSVYAKANTQNFCVIQINTSVNTQAAFVTFDLTNGSVGTPSNLTGVLALTASSTLVGNGWYRCVVTYTGTTDNVIYIGAASTANTRNGDAGGTISIWGAQLEAGAFATSYIPTTTATVTRAADVASITGSNFSSFYNQTEGTVFMGYLPIGLRTSYPLSIDDGTTNNFIGFGFDSGASRFARIDTGGVTQASITQGLVSVGSESKGALAFAINNVAASFNGTVPTADTSATIPTVDRVRLHALGGSTTFALNGTIKRLTYWPVRLQNNTLQAITQL